jgi:hypothetical protein
MREYTDTQTLTANLPYAAMVVMGSIIIASSYRFSAGALAGAFAFLAYGIAGAVWVMVFICRHCDFYGTRGCPCGYGMWAAKLVRKAERECFATKFKRHIPVIVPLWLIPPACGGMALWRGYSNSLAVLLALFALDAFVLLPLVSRRHSCTECPQKDGCPWMALKGETS